MSIAFFLTACRGGGGGGGVWIAVYSSFLSVTWNWTQRLHLGPSPSPSHMESMNAIRIHMADVSEIVKKTSQQAFHAVILERYLGRIGSIVGATLLVTFAAAFLRSSSCLEDLASLACYLCPYEVSFHICCRDRLRSGIRARAKDFFLTILTRREIPDMPLSVYLTE